MSEKARNRTPVAIGIGLVLLVALVIGYAALLRRGYPPGIEFLNHYQVVHRGSENDPEGHPASVFWVRAPIKEIKDKIMANPTGPNGGSTMTSSDSEGVRACSKYSFTTGEGWYAMPGQVSRPNPSPSFPPSQGQEVAFGTRRAWTTLYYTLPSRSSPTRSTILTLLRRLFG